MPCMLCARMPELAGYRRNIAQTPATNIMGMHNIKIILLSMSPGCRQKHIANGLDAVSPPKLNGNVLHAAMIHAFTLGVTRLPDASRANFSNLVGDTASVGNSPAGISPFGVLDMSGNVAEWTQ